ncbi:hypothetical protein D3C81_1191770 [compost metagenome]
MIADARVVGLPIAPLLEAEPFGETYSAPATGAGVEVGDAVAVAVGAAVGLGVAVAVGVGVGVDVGATVAVGTGVAVPALETTTLSNFAAVL